MPLSSRAAAARCGSWGPCVAGAHRVQSPIRISHPTLVGAEKGDRQVVVVKVVQTALGLAHVRGVLAPKGRCAPAAFALGCPPAEPGDCAGCPRPPTPHGRGAVGLRYPLAVAEDGLSRCRLATHGTVGRSEGRDCRPTTRRSTSSTGGSTSEKQPTTRHRPGDRTEGGSSRRPRRRSGRRGVPHPGRARRGRVVCGRSGQGRPNLAGLPTHVCLVQDQARFDLTLRTLIRLLAQAGCRPIVDQAGADGGSPEIA